MKKINEIIKNISLTLLFVMPIIIIVIKSNGITLMNNLYIYAYLTVYICIATIYVKIKRDKNVLKFTLILVTIYSIAVLHNYIGTYEINRLQNKNTIIVNHFYDSFLSGDPDEISSKFYKRVYFFFKKDLNAPTFHGNYSIYQEDEYIIIAGDAAKNFIESYKTSEENSYFKNTFKNSNFEILPNNLIKINLIY